MDNQNKPSLEEFFEAFSSSILENLPSSIKSIGSLIYPYISKAKSSIYDMVTTNTEGQIIININKEILDNIISDFISKQGFIARNIIKPIMKSNYIDSMDNFISSVKKGKNNYEKIIQSLINILISTINKLSNKYNIKDDKDSITKKITNIFL